MAIELSGGLSLWAAEARNINWFAAPRTTIDGSRPPFYRWFPSATCNTCFNSLDRHVEAGRGDQVAIIYESPVTGQRAEYTYRTLLERTARFAGALQDLGVGKGDRVVIYMPMVPEAVIAMQACARIGAIHSVVFGGFAAQELASRIDDCRPALIISASCGIEPSGTVAYKPLLDKALTLATHQPGACVILQRDQLQADLVEGRDLDWVAVETSGKPVACVELAASDPLYIIYTSGTTGSPKGIVRDNGGHLVAMSWSLRNIYGIGPGDVFWAASDIGWVVGHSYIVYGPLIVGATAVLFEGKPVGTPDAEAYWRVIERNHVKAMFTAPTAIRAIKQCDPAGNGPKNYDLSSLKTLFLAGERADPETVQWAERHIGVPVIDHWWQTELGWPAVANCAGLGLFPVRYGSSGKPVPGFDIAVLSPEGEECAPDVMGALAIRLPLPPGALTTLWNNDNGFVDKYFSEFPGYYSAGDAGFIDRDGYVHIMGRTDDVINVAGHRLSTGQMEEVVAAHPDVAECAVFGINDELKGQVPCCVMVLSAGVTTPVPEVEAQVVALIRDRIGPVAAFKIARVARILPKTRSGKILRSTMQKIANGEPYTVPATIEDRTALDEAIRLFGPDTANRFARVQ